MVVATWVPSGKPVVPLITEYAPSPATNDYTFVWPTQKYLDASGTLRVYYGSTSSTPVSVPVTLSNGNITDFRHSPNDWQNFLPNPSWTQPTDPVVIAVGDGASNEKVANDNAARIAAAQPPLFLYLGDIYENGTATENLNAYGRNSMDGGPGTLWGQLGVVTQPALGDHEDKNFAAWSDYFHGRPKYTTFRFGNVLFLDLASAGESMAKGSAQYNFVQSVLTDPANPAPPCVIAYFQNPVIAKGGVATKRVDMWSLILHNGGDLVLSGNAHNMSQYKPLNDQVGLPAPGDPTMIQMIAGSGGHKLGGTFPDDPKLEWSKGKTPGALHITLNGAANGGTPTSLSWAFEDKNGTVLHTGSRDCGGGSPPPSAPRVDGFSPTFGPVGTSVTINGSGFTGATDVAFNGTTLGAGNFTVDSDTQITAPVPSGATSGPISVTTPLGTGTSSTSFSVTGPVLAFGADADTWVQSDLPNANNGAKAVVKVDGDPTKNGLYRFTVSGVGANAIANVTLRLYCTDGSSDGGSVYPIADNTWGETTVTYANAPQPSGPAITSLGAVGIDTWVSVDLTPYITGDGTYSFQISSPATNSSMYVSKEGTPGSTPQLLVTLA